jgi:hypothetical protein
MSIVITKVSQKRRRTIMGETTAHFGPIQPLCEAGQGMARRGHAARGGHEIGTRDGGSTYLQLAMTHEVDVRRAMSCSMVLASAARSRVSLLLSPPSSTLLLLGGARRAYHSNIFVPIPDGNQGFPPIYRVRGDTRTYDRMRLYRPIRMDRRARYLHNQRIRVSSRSTTLSALC